MTDFFFTWTAQERARPIDIVGGMGAWFDTSDGSRWLDLASLSFQANLGHGSARMIEAVRAQASRLCLAPPNAVYPEKVAVARGLLDRMPEGFGKVFFALGGAEANENAIKIARMFTGRHKIVSRYQSYHGSTMGAVTLTGDWRRAPTEPGLVGIVHVDDWHCPSCPHSVRARTCTHEPLTHIPRALELEGAGTVAAVIVEPVTGANGVHIPPPGYMRRLREACDAHGALLIIDEVLTGFGRTGRWFCFEHFDGVVPDMVTMSKGITAGYGTLAAVVVHDRVARFFDKNVLYAGLTQYAHPLALAAAKEALAIYEDDKLVERAAALEPVLHARLETIGRRFAGSVRQSRVIGLLSGTEIATDAAGWARIDAALEEHRVSTHVLPRHGVLVLAPPLCITEDELVEGLSRVQDALAEGL